MLRIKEAREARGWTQERLAAELDTTQQTVQRWESGQTDPKASVILEISRILGITVSFILNLDESDEVKTLSNDERELLTLYRGLSNDHKHALVAVAETFNSYNTDGVIPLISTAKLLHDENGELYAVELEDTE